MTEHFMPVKLISGEGAVTEHGGIFAQFGEKCLIVMSGTAAVRSGALDDTEKVLGENGISYTVFSGIGQNPLISACEEAGLAARRTKADFIIGIGGGSALDAAKAAAIFAADATIRGTGIYTRAIPSKRLPVLLIGTTSGTGSEVTGVSVLTSDETGRKKSISGEDCYARVSFCDPRYTYSLPFGNTASTALDAFSHAAESWFSPKCGALPTAFASLSLPVSAMQLKKLYETKELPDRTGRELLSSAAIYAGLAINTCGTAFPHTLGYVLTEEFGIPHGRACTAFLPFFLERAEKFCPERFEAFKKSVTLPLDEVQKIIFELTNVRLSAGEEQIGAWCARFCKVKNFDNSPGGFAREDAKQAFLTLTR